MVGTIVGSIIGGIIVILIIYFIVAYNKLVSFSARVDNGWSQINVQLKKRFDLIPNLVETVKGYATHEKETLENVIKWRAAAMKAKTPEEVMESNQHLGQAIANIFATAENYPDLKANANFMQLQVDLKDIETKIAMSRQFYNDTVMRYNEYCRHFPSNIIASIFRFEKRQYFEMPEEETAVPKVQF